MDSGHGRPPRHPGWRWRHRVARRHQAAIARQASSVTPALFVTGTDTAVGKTRVAAALCRGLAARGIRVAAMKPVASGCALTPEGLRNEDALALLAAMNVRARYSDVNPYAFAPAIAPHIRSEER